MQKQQKTIITDYLIQIKVFFIFVGLLCTSTSFSTNYYINSNIGDDLNSGLSPTSAWKTLTKVNSYSFSAGDSILFNRGGIWRGQLIPRGGNKNSNITYSAYGIGDKPLLLGSVNVSNASDWILIGNNVWQSVQSSTVDVGNIIFNNGATCGVKKWNSTDLKSQGDYWWDKSGTQKVTIFSISNPAIFYTDIEAALGNFIVYLQMDSFVVIQNMTFKYGAADGIEVRNTHHFTLKNCDVSYMGGTELNTQQRYGGGIQFYANSNNNTVEDCRFWEIYDDGVTNQSNSTVPGSVKQFNIHYINNLIWNCGESSFCYFLRASQIIGSEMKNIYFENNTCVNSGGGWAANQRPDLKGFQVYISNSNVSIDSVFIRNNIFYKSRCFIFVDNTTFHTWSNTNSNYNCWFTTNMSDTIVAFWTATAATYYTKSQFLNYQTLNDKDINSFIADPLFVDPTNNNYYLSPASPCINSGINTGVAFDFNLIYRPQGEYFDIGAFEFINATEDVANENPLFCKIYPNPNSGLFTLGKIESDSEIKIYNSMGQIVYQLDALEINSIIDLTMQPNGVYILWAINKNKKNGCFEIYNC